VPGSVLGYWNEPVSVEIAVKMDPGTRHFLGAAIFLVALIFVYRSFYGMRIPVDQDEAVVDAQMKQD